MSAPAALMQKGEISSEVDGARSSIGGGAPSSPAAESKVIDQNPIGQSQAVGIQAQMLIKTGALAFQVKSFSKAKEEITALIPRFSGYISSENEDTYGENHQCVMAIRVPSAQFDKLVNEISKSASNFDQRQISVQDVGEEFADVTARMNAKLAVEQRYVAILARANKISEILEIEQKIGEVRAEIESMQGRLNYLKNQVSYSTLTVTFYERTPITATQRINFFSQILSSVKNGWVGLLNFVVHLMAIWPFLLFVTGVVVLIRRGVKKKKKQSQ